MEKVNISLNEKQKKSNLLEKKVHDLEKQQTRVNTEKNEQLNSELQKMKQKYLQVIDEKDRLVEELAHVSAEKRSLKLAQDNFSRELSSSKQIYDRHEKKLKEELKEYSNKYQLLEAKYDTQKHEFKSQIQKYCSENEKLMNESKNLKKSTEKQKSAYLERINGLETDLGITEKSLFDKDAKIDKLQVELSALKQEFSNKKFGHESAAAENIRLKEQYEKSQHELLAAKSKVSSLEEKLNSVRQSNELTLLDYRNKCSSLENELLIKSEEVKAHSQKISKAKEDMGQIKSAADFELQSIERKLAQKEENIKKLRAEIDRNGETVESIHRNHSATIQALKNDVDEANAHNQQLESLLSAAKTEFRDFKAKEESNRQNLESSLDSAKRSLKNITDSFTNEISALNRQIEAKSSKCGQLEAEINSLKSQLLEKGSHSHNEISNLLKLVDELKLEIKEKDEEFMVELQSLNFKLSAAESRFVELQDSKDEEITLLNVERVRIEGSLHRAIADSENFQNQYRAQTALLRETDLKLQRLKQSSDHSSIKLSEEIRALHQNIEVLEAEKATLLSNFDAERELLEETASKLSKEHKSQLDGLAEENKLLQFQLEELQTENNILEDSKCKIQAQLQESVSKFSETQNDVNNSRQQLLLELSVLKTERDSLREENRELSLTAEKFSSCFTTSEKELEAARDEVRIAQAALNSQTARAATIEQEFTELKSRLDKSSTDYQALEQELERSLSEGALLESVCKQRSNEIASLLARVDTFTQEKKAYLSKIQELDENYEEAKEECGRIQLELQNLRESSKIERKRLDGTISELKGDNVNLQQELVIVQDKLVECQAMVLKNASGHEGAVQSLRSTDLALQEQIQECDRLAKSIEIAKGEEELLKEKLDQLTILHAETLAQNTKKNSEFEQQIESLKAEKATLENKLLSVTSQIESYDTKWTDLEAERAALNLQIKDLELKIQASKSNEEELVRNCDAKQLALEEEQEMAEEQRILFAEKQCALQSELENCKKSLELANSNFETANANLQKHSVEFLALKSDNEQKAEELKTAEEELSSALSRLMENQRNHNEKVKQLSDNIREKEIRLLRLQESLDVTKKTMEDVLIEKDQLNLKLESEMSSSLDQINKLKDNLELMSVQLESKSLSYSKLEEERSNLAVKLKQKEDQLTATFKSVTILESTKLQLLAEVKTLELKIEKSEVAKVEFEGKYHSASNEVMALQQELEFVKSSSKAEFDELRERIKESKSNGYRDGAKFEKSVQELSERLAERNAHIKVLESDLDDAKAINSRAELRLMNETSSRDLSIRNLETKLREKTRMVDKATEEKLEIERQLYEKDLYIKTVLQEEFEDKLSLAKKIWDQERSLLERDLHDWELREQELFVEIDK